MTEEGGVGGVSETNLCVGRVWIVWLDGWVGRGVQRGGRSGLGLGGLIIYRLS